MFEKRLYISIGVAVAALFLIACDADIENITVSEPVTVPTAAETDSIEVASSVRDFSGVFGLPSLEEKILRADIVAIVTLRSVDRGLDVWKALTRIRYAKTLEFTFDVEQYLKGEDADQIVGVVFDWADEYESPIDASLAKDPAPDRKTHWDDRKAVVFLRDDAKDPRVNWKAGRYFLGVTFEEDAYYSIEGDGYNPWLPAVSNRDDEQRILLESDLGVSSPKTTTLDKLRLLVKSLEQEVKGRSDEYKDCILSKYRRRSIAKHSRETRGDSYYIKTYSTIGSGMPQGTYVASGWLAWEHYQTPEDGKHQIVLAGKDPEHFYGVAPGHIYTERPIPAGQYRTNYADLFYEDSMCGGTVPEDEMARAEIIVNVTAPSGTLHEAFFDPAEDGKAVVADNTVGVLEPAIFTDANGVEATIQRIAWEAESGGVGTVKLDFISPHNSIAGHTVDFIALNGSVPLSLAVADAQVDATNGTLTWKVQSQPWQSGDKLMLRVSAPVS